MEFLPYPKMKKTMPAILAIALGVSIFSPAIFAETPAAPKTVVFLGDSLTAGLGVQPAEAFPALVAEKIRAAGVPFQVENAGLSGDTRAGGLRRMDWRVWGGRSLLGIQPGRH